MKLIVISRPDLFPNEDEAIRVLLENGVDNIHIRKPDSKTSHVAKLLDKIPMEYFSRLTLNGDFRLLNDYKFGGVHLNSKNPTPPKDFNGNVSHSCHSLEEVESKLNEMDYTLLSPIFDSVSKQGYKASFPYKELEKASSAGIINSRVVALGGVTPDKISQLKYFKFGGCAILGYIWQSRNYQEIIAKIKDIKSRF